MCRAGYFKAKHRCGLRKEKKKEKRERKRGKKGRIRQGQDEERRGQTDVTPWVYHCLTGACTHLLLCLHGRGQASDMANVVVINLSGTSVDNLSSY